MLDEVDKVKRKEDWRVEYMTMMELERQRYREGMERGMARAKEKYREGMEQGIERGMKRGISQGEAKMLIKMSRKSGLDDTTILQSLQDMLGVSLEQATIYLREYTE